MAFFVSVPVEWKEERDEQGGQEKGIFLR